LASQLSGSFVTVDAPFFVYPYVGTPNIGRGYSDRRFMDRTLINIQSELRFSISGRFGAVTFISLSSLGESPEELIKNRTKLSAGLGLRYILNKEERTKIRLDFGFTNEGFNFYITANEAF
jgi:hypothetical protein